MRVVELKHVLTNKILFLNYLNKKKVNNCCKASKLRIFFFVEQARNLSHTNYRTVECCSDHDDKKKRFTRANSQFQKKCENLDGYRNCKFLKENLVKKFEK